MQAKHLSQLDCVLFCFSGKNSSRILFDLLTRLVPSFSERAIHDHQNRRFFKFYNGSHEESLPVSRIA